MKVLVDIIFGSGGIFAVLIWLRGRKDPSTTTLENGNIKTEVSGDGNHIEVKPQAYRLASEPKIRKCINGVIQPLKSPGMTKIEIKRRNRTLQTVKKEEAPYLSVEPPEEEVFLEKEGVHEVTRTAYLEIVKLSFKEDNKWSFSDGSGGLLTAGIEDQGFQEKVTRHQYSFGNGDQLKVSLRTRT